jgi:hypothetical protein
MREEPRRYGILRYSQGPAEADLDGFNSRWRYHESPATAGFFRAPALMKRLLLPFSIGCYTTQRPSRSMDRAIASKKSDAPEPIRTRARRETTSPNNTPSASGGDSYAVRSGELSAAPDNLRLFQSPLSRHREERAPLGCQLRARKSVSAPSTTGTSMGVVSPKPADLLREPAHDARQHTKNPSR